MIRQKKFRTILGWLVIAVVCALTGCEEAATGAPEEDHAQWIQGSWVYTSAVTRLSGEPDSRIDLAEYSEITIAYGPDSFHEVCFPACFETVRQSWGVYHLDQNRGTVRTVVTDVDLEAEHEQIRGQLVGEERLGRYTFESRDVLVIRGKQFTSEGPIEFVFRLRRTE